MKIAVIGTPGSGKSTLVFSLELFFRKKGFKTGSANFDFNAKKLKFKPFFDVRKTEKNLEKFLSNLQTAKKYFNSECEDLDFVFIDIGAPLETLLTTNLPEIADAFLFVFADFSDLSVLNALHTFLSDAFKGKPVVFLKGKSDLKKKKTLMSSFSNAKQLFIEVCGVDRRGFDEVYSLILSLKENKLNNNK
ncbi:MAG: ATP/GTP-binding protein [Candidatus Marsarchaeota archaeon]|nr:ATP/GTP-binding protein [Candidatus Marsarchaeota archaeon]